VFIASITVDIERDWGGRAETFVGLTSGLPILLDLFDRYRIPATFFATCDILEAFPKTRDLLARYEVGCHGLKHIRLPATYQECLTEVSVATRCVAKLASKPKGFRAPFLSPPTFLADILNRLGYLYDSSLVASAFPGRYFSLGIPNKPYLASEKNIRREGDAMIEVPITATNLLRIPCGFSYLKNISFAWKLLLSGLDPIILYLHPHEFSNISSKYLPFHLKWTYGKKLGKEAVLLLERLICERLDRYEFVSCEKIAGSYLKR